MDIKRVDLFNKETSDTIVMVDYSTKIVYTGRNRRSLQTIQLILYSLITLLLDCPRDHVRLFISTTVDIIKSLNVTPVDDYK